VEPLISRPEVGERTMRTARGIAVLSFGEIVGKLCTLALIVSAARSLGPTDFGVFALALSVGTLAAIIPSWGFDTAVVQSGSADRGLLPLLLAELLVLRTLLAVPVLAVLGAVQLLARGAGVAGWSGILVLIACLLDTYADGFRSIATACQMQGRCAVVQILQRAVGCTLVVVAAALHAGLLAVSAGYLCGSVVGVVGMVVAIRRLGIVPAWHAVTRTGVRALNAASGLLGVNAVVSMALLRIDAVLLGVIAGDLAVGLYAAAYRLLETVLFVGYAVTRAVFPVVASKPDPARARRGMRLGTVILATAFVPYAVLLLLRGPQILSLLYGSRYSQGVQPILAWLSTAPLLYGVGFLTGAVLIALGQRRPLLIGGVIALALNVAMNLALIPSLGGAGAAIATVAGYLVETSILLLVLVRSLPGVWSARSLLPAAAGTLAAAAVLAGPARLFVALVLACLAFVLTWLPLVRWLDPEQLQVLRRLVQRSAR
jgi:O-antigen/teichoic acid export membrane protein